MRTGRFSLPRVRRSVLSWQLSLRSGPILRLCHWTFATKRQLPNRLGFFGTSKSLDVLVNNAAIFPGEGDEPFERVDPEWFNEAFDCNVTGVARMTRAFLPHLKNSANARVANISSGAGSISEKEDFAYYPYSVSKAALNMLTRALSAEFRSKGIVMAAISPGWVKTEMGGPNAPLTPHESARTLFQTITGLTMEQTGKFLGRNGEPYAW